MTGGCLCGNVRYEITGELGAGMYCHCKRCQRRSGCAASAQVRIWGSRMKILSGEDRLRAFSPPTGFEKVFCGDCGSAMFSRTSTGNVGVRLGVLDGDPGVRPSAHGFTAYAASWEAIPDDGLPRHLEAAPPPPTA